MTPCRLHRILILAFAGTTLASSAIAQTTSGIDLSWHDCIGLPSASQNLAFACDGTQGGQPFKLVIAFASPTDLPAFAGFQATIDMRTGTSSLPDWWRLGVGECRDGFLTFPTSLSGVGTGTTGTCRDSWRGANTGGGYQWYTEDTYGGFPGSWPGRGRLKMAFARDDSAALVSGQRYLGGVIRIDPGDPVTLEGPPVLDTKWGRQAAPQGGTDPTVVYPCSGCGEPACLVLQQVELYQIVGSPGGDIIFLNRPLTQMFVTWQGGEVGGNGCPLSVPVKRATWGAIKAIYR